MPDSRSAVTENAWHVLRRYTDARIGLGRAGVSLPTREVLSFQLAHAQARDAVHLPLDTDRLIADLAQIDGLGAPVLIHTTAADRADYLRYPPKGERLDPGSRQLLRDRGDPAPDLALVIADGLSSFAVQNNAVPFLGALLAALQPLRISVSRPVIVREARVAVGDDVGAALGARASLVLVGERPGLSSPDSLGLYFTWTPEVGLHNARRNCISNIRRGGLGYAIAARRACYLYEEATRLQTSGVALKDRSAEGEAPAARGQNTAPLADGDIGILR